MGFQLHANGDDPPEVRNWRVHLMAIIVSMGALASEYITKRSKDVISLSDPLLL
jgi:hypothetical protein